MQVQQHILSSLSYETRYAYSTYNATSKNTRSSSFFITLLHRLIIITQGVSSLNYQKHKELTAYQQPIIILNNGNEFISNSIQKVSCQCPWQWSFILNISFFHKYSLPLNTTSKVIMDDHELEEKEAFMVDKHLLCTLAQNLL